MITKEDIRTVGTIHPILVCAEDFIYLLPHPGLQNKISNYTITFPNQNMMSDNYTVIPHGSATLVFSYDEKGLHGNLFGPATKPSVVGHQANCSKMLLIIEFQPAGLYAFIGENQKELADTVIPFEMINKRLNQLIIGLISKANSINELLTGLDKLLLTNMPLSCPCELPFANKLIIKNAGNISIKQLSDSVYYSERHLNRIFDQYLGMSTKSFSRLVRMNKTIRLLRNPHNSITYCSSLAGFHDLPHFIHDFKSLCGLTPQEYRSNMSDFYSEIAKF
jgi:AraC-like DNA-binding protein